MTSNAAPSNILLFDRTSEEYKRLVTAVANSAVLFVGAGSSCRVGYPSWPQLLDRLHDAIAGSADHPELTDLAVADGLIRASTYRKILGEERYHQLLIDFFGQRVPPHDAFHETLVGLPFGHVLTTNYDYVLESAHANVYSVDAEHFDIDEWTQLSNLWQSPIASGRQRRYVHVHGSISRPSGIVLCQEDYDARYIHETRAKEFLKGLLIGQRIVFVGYSLSDVDLAYILREVAGTLGISQPRHFVLLAAPTSPQDQATTRLNYTKKYHVEPVFFDNSFGNHASLVALIDALKEDVTAEQKRNEAKQYIDIEEVPSLVAHLLEGQSEGQEHTFQHRLTALLQRHAVPLTLQDTSSGTTDIDGEITQVFSLVEGGRPADAIDSYEAIGRKYQNQLTARHRYRLSANIGHALYAQGEYETAGNAYLEAAGYYRGSRDAQALEGLGYLLLGDLQKASELAETLCANEPDFARARSLWIRAQRDDIEFGAVLASVPEGLREDPEVALALGDLAHRRGDFATAEERVRQALIAAPLWRDAQNMLAALILSSEKDKAQVTIDQGFIAASQDRVREADEILTSVIEHTPASDPSGSLGVAFYNRAAARRLLGNHQGASDDMATAFLHDAQNPAIAFAFALDAERDADRLKALQAIEGMPDDIAERDQLLFAKLFLLNRRGLPEDIKQATVIIRDVVSRLQQITPASLRPDFVRMGLRILTAAGHEAECVPFVSSVPANSLPAYSLALIKGNAELAAGHREHAIEHAQQAIKELRSDASWFEKREIALLTENCGLHAVALNLWESALAGSFSGSDTDHLVRCALLAGEWKRLLEACARLRSSGRLRRNHVLAEAHVLSSSRETARALSVLQAWLIDHPDDKSVRLRLSTLALHYGRLELAEFDENKLPTVQELSDVHDGAALVYVLRRGEFPHRAFEIAYDLYRRFPDSPVTHCTLTACVFDPSVDQIDIDRPTVVGKNTAVCLRRSSDKDNHRWVYVEGGPEPAVTRGEYGETHELVKSLWGKSAGNRLEFQGHQYEVIGVENKALRRVHEIMETFEENFPDIPFLRRFNVPRKEPSASSPEELLGEVYTELKKQAEHREQLEALYMGNQLPITCFAKLMGRPAFDAVRYFAFDPSHVVRVHTGHPADWTGALKALDGKKELVLDSTALASALILDLLNVLPQSGHKFIVPQSVMDELREMSLNAGSRRTSRHTIAFHQGRVMLHESSPEELAREVEALEKVQRFVSDNCEVVGGEATLDLEAALRGQLESSLGEAATDALALAKRRNGLLWTDDLGIRAFGVSSDFRVRATWTQAVMLSARLAGSIRQSDYDKCLCKLVRFRYAFTTLAARDIAMLLARAGWRSNNTLGLAAIRLVAEVGLMTPHNCIIVGASFLLIWQQAPRRSLARDIIVAVLEEVGRGRAEPLIAAVCSNPMPMFREKRVRPLKRMLRSWRGRDKEFRPGRMTRRGPVS